MQENHSSANLPFSSAQALAVLHRAREMALGLSGRVQVFTKSDGTLVTEADQRLEEFLLSELTALAPKWSFLGEEGGLRGSTDEPCWVIDPIDGTINFVQGIPIWCISVGAVFQGRPIFGMIDVPQLGETYWAAPGHGAWLIKNGQSRELKLAKTTPLTSESLLTFNTSTVESVDLRSVPGSLRNFGSIAYHLCLLSRGALLANISQYHKLYDVAAALCIAHEAGYCSRQWDGRPWKAQISMSTQKQPVLTASPQMLDFLMEKLRVVNICLY